MKIILIGFAACYKTSVGKLLAARLKYSFFDVDQQIEKITGKTVSQIFKTDGEEIFRKTETAALKELADLSNAVIACGGGSVLSSEFSVFARNGKVVWLRGNAQTVKSRLTFGTRPLFDDLTDFELQQKISEREKVYAKFADFSIFTDGKTSVQVAEEVAVGLK